VLNNTQGTWLVLIVRIGVRETNVLGLLSLFRGRSDLSDRGVPLSLAVRCDPTDLRARIDPTDPTDQIDQHARDPSRLAHLGLLDHRDLLDHHGRHDLIRCRIHRDLCP
jgi:hypothetical protein